MPTTINGVFEKVMKKGQFKNQADMINELDIARSYYFKVKKKEHFLSDEKARKLAELAELPIDYVLVMNNFEKCKDAEAKDAYEGVLMTIRHLRTQGQ